VIPGFVALVMIPVVVVPPVTAMNTMIVIKPVVPSALLVDHHLLHDVAVRVIAIVVAPVHPVDHHPAIAVTSPLLAVPPPHPFHYNESGRMALDDDHTAGLPVTRVFVCHDNAAGDWTASDDNLARYGLALKRCCDERQTRKE
jgi:hypothetical protein